MDNIGRAAVQLNNILKPMVAMFVQQVKPADDELSMNAAYQDYGRAWVEDQRRRGNLTVRYKGNRKVLSRADIECLIAAERETPSIIIK